MEKFLEFKELRAHYFFIDDLSFAVVGLVLVCCFGSGLHLFHNLFLVKGANK